MNSCSLSVLVLSCIFSQGTIQSMLLSSPLRCSLCHGVLQPRDCNAYTTCKDDEMCFTRGYITTEGHRLYEMGCMRTEYCYDKVTVKSRDTHVAAVYVEECCAEQECNRDLFQPKRSALSCGQCDFVSDPRECHLVKTCKMYEMCWYMLYVNDLNEAHYVLDCMPADLCREKEEASRRATDITYLYSSCCKDDYCNVVESINFHENITNESGTSTTSETAIDVSQYITPPAKTTGPIICSLCHGVLQPQDCEEYVECEADEMCFARGYITVNGHKLYEMGCMLNKFCEKSENRLKRRDNEGGAAAVYVEECCPYDICNRGLFKPRPITTFCGLCENVNDPKDCHEVKTCQTDEICWFRFFVNDLTETQYILGCAERSKCSKFDRTVRSDDGTRIYSQCCEGDFCNVINAIDYHEHLNNTRTSNGSTTPTTITEQTTENTEYIETKLTTATTRVTDTASTTRVITTTSKASDSTTTTTATTLTTTSTTTTSSTIITTTTTSTTTTIPTTPTTTVFTTTTTITTTTTTTTTTTDITTTASTTPTTFPTTTATTTTTTAAAITKSTLKSVLCYICDGNDCYFEKTPRPCTNTNHYCFTHVDIRGPGNVGIKKRCAKKEECQQKWWEATSDRSQCTHLTDHMFDSRPFSCDFCCVTDRCNNALLPNKNTLFKGTA